jgi:uncharacterized protein (DUF305 family)
LAALILLLAVGCGQETPDVPVNAADVMFVQMMVPHHRQGIEIAEVGTSRATTPQLRTLTEAIVSTQQDEVEMLLRWLHSWDRPAHRRRGRARPPRRHAGDRRQADPGAQAVG